MGKFNSEGRMERLTQKKLREMDSEEQVSALDKRRRQQLRNKIRQKAREAFRKLGHANPLDAEVMEFVRLRLLARKHQLRPMDEYVAQQVMLQFSKTPGDARKADSNLERYRARQLKKGVGLIADLGFGEEPADEALKKELSPEGQEVPAAAVEEAEHLIKSGQHTSAWVPQGASRPRWHPLEEERTRLEIAKLKAEAQRIEAEVTLYGVMSDRHFEDAARIELEQTLCKIRIEREQLELRAARRREQRIEQIEAGGSEVAPVFMEVSDHA